MRIRPIALMIALAAVLGTLAVAQMQDHSGMQQTAPQATSSEHGDMMKAGQKHHAEAVAALDKAEASIAIAAASTDPAKTKVALEDARKQILAAKHHMSMCPMMKGEMHHDMNHTDMQK